jgi:hypothetical protein
VPDDWRDNLPKPDDLEQGGHLPPTLRLWPDEQAGPWLLVFFWQVIDGRAECVGMDITSTRSPHVEQWWQLEKRPELGSPLRTSLLRELRLSELIAEQRASEQFRLENFTARPEQGPLWAEVKASMRPATAKRLEQVAKVYRSAWARGGQPTQAVAKRFNVSPGAAASLVSRARAAGLLPPTSPGKATGQEVKPSE